MWPWDSVANECEFIGSSGVDWVLVSPAQEHIEGGAWWTNYQPVSYQIQSRLGNREQFQNMVSTCAEFGVDVIVGFPPFGGAVPLIQFYNRALSSTEVLANYNATKGRFGL